MAERIITADEARALREAATPGPWDVYEDGLIWPADGSPSEGAFDPVGGALEAGDVALFAAAPDLAASVEHHAALADRLKAERDRLLEEKGTWINLGTSADLRADRMTSALARIGVMVYTGANRPTLDLAERQLRADVAAARQLADAALAHIDRLTRERDEARATSQPAWTDIDAVRSIIRLECEECGIELPPEDADVPAQLRHLLGGRDAMEVALKAERDRVARILAIERGDGSQAPEGWISNHAGDMWHRTRSGRTVWIHRFAPDGVSLWEMRGVRRDDPRHRAWATALEAMEAIDAEVSRG